MWILVLLSFLNALQLWRQKRVYTLYKRQDRVNSPNASFVDADLDWETPSLWERFSKAIW